MMNTEFRLTFFALRTASLRNWAAMFRRPSVPPLSGDCGFQSELIPLVTLTDSVTFRRHVSFKFCDREICSVVAAVSGLPRFFLGARSMKPQLPPITEIMNLKGITVYWIFVWFGNLQFSERRKWVFLFKIFIPRPQAAVPFPTPATPLAVAKYTDARIEWYVPPVLRSVQREVGNRL